MADLSGLKFRIEEVKEKFKYSNEQLGDLCGVSYNTIRKILIGETRDPSVSIFIDLSQKLGISIKWLLFNEGNMFDKKTQHEVSGDPAAFVRSYREKEEMYKIMLKTKDEQIEILQKMVNFLEDQNSELMDKHTAKLKKKK